MSYRERIRKENDAAREWKGGYRPYDLIKELSIAIGVVIGLVLVLTVLFSSPDDPPSTVKTWSRTNPVDFVTTAVSELDGSSGTAGYGPPYNHGGDGQHMLFIRPQKWFGVSHPIDTTNDFVLAPLSAITGQPALTSAIATYKSASSDQQMKWTTAYTNALAKATANSDGSVTVPGDPASFGPVPVLMDDLLTFAQSGGLDGALLTNKQFYQNDYTKPLLFIADSAGAETAPGSLAYRANQQHLLGTQWGMMNETGSYPGQVWLWLYTFWYQIKPFSTSANADILVMAVMGVMSLLFILIPLIPGIRDLPRWIPLYKLIWRDHYRSLAKS
jgi:hypothetical protein